MDNFTKDEKSKSLSPNFNTNLGQPGTPIIQPPTGGSGYPLPGSYSQSQGGYPLPEPVINATAPGTVYTPLAGMEPPNAEENWMPVPVGVPICPPGLEYLTVIDQLIFHQKGEVLEEMFKFLPRNQFSIKNSFGQNVYFAKEETDWTIRSLCRPMCPFHMNIKDSAGKDVIQLIGDLKSGSCCLKLMEVMSPPGMLIGSVVQEFTMFYPHLNVLDASGEVVLIIKGPFIGFNFFRDVDFKVLSKDSAVEVGCIRKLYSDFVTEAFTDADNFVVTFPMDLDVNIKAVLLGACMLIDLLYFEEKGRRRRRRRRRRR